MGETHPIAMAEKTPQRRKLLKVDLGGKHVTSCDVREIRLKPGEQGGRHIHPCAVLGYIVEGTAVYQVEGQPAETLPEGSAFYEPPETIIADFGNASDSKSLTFIAFYLLDGDQELIRMLS